MHLFLLKKSFKFLIKINLSTKKKGILSPPGPFLTPSQSPSIQHSPRLQPSPSPFQQQDVLIVTNNNQHYINTFTTQEQVSEMSQNLHFSNKINLLLGSKNWNAK